MAVNSTIKRKTASGYEEIHPKTNTDQVQGLSTALSNITIDNLNDITDVNAASPSDGQALVWDNATSKWIPGTASGGGDVQTVNSVSPDGNGNVQLTASDVGAAANTHTHAISAITNLQTSLNAKQDDLGTGTNGQFLRWGALGDPYWDTVTASEVGAASSSHTHTFDSLTSKPTTLSGYGITDAYSSSNPSGYQTAAQVASSISALVDSAPGTLDTLNELAAALGDDPNFATTVSNSIGTKVSKSGDTMTGSLTVNNNGANGNGFISRYSGSVLNFQIENYATQTTLRSDTDTLYFWQPSSSYQMKLINNAGVHLAYDGNFKLETLSNGVYVNGNLGVNTTGPSRKIEAVGGHGDSTMRVRADNGGNPPAYLDFYASEPGQTYNGVGIGNNINGQPYYGKFTNSQGGSYVRFVDGNIGFYTSPATTAGFTERMWLSQSGVLTIGGNTAWHAGNDGSGSGLSADNVDGYHIVVGSTGSDASTLYFVT